MKRRSKKRTNLQSCKPKSSCRLNQKLCKKSKISKQLDSLTVKSMVPNNFRYSWIPNHAHISFIFGSSTTARQMHK